MSIINWDIVRNPYNWGTVVVMALFGLSLFAIIFKDR